MVDEDGERELLRAFALVGPFEAVFGEALDLIVLVEALAVDGDDEAVDGALALVRFHRRLRHSPSRAGSSRGSREDGRRPSPRGRGRPWRWRAPARHAAARKAAGLRPPCSADTRTAAT